MADAYVYGRDFCDQAQVRDNGILSQTLRNEVLGEAQLNLGPDEQQAAECSFVYMPPNLDRGIKARREVVMLLAMMKTVWCRLDQHRAWLKAPFRGGLAKPYFGRGLIQNSDSLVRRAMKQFNQS